MIPVNVRITTFINPFSFFCIRNDQSSEHKSKIPSLKNNDEWRTTIKKSMTDVNHGQYVAVIFKDKWTRGVVTMESQFLIWLVDYGLFIQPDDKTVYIDLPQEYKKYPTKVFEAAVHGVIPLDKYLSDDFRIDNKLATSWNKGAIEKCQELIRESVLGDLYVEKPGKKVVNLVNELELWPVFLEKKKIAYIENLAKLYISRRKHRACILGPEFPAVKLQVVTPAMSLEEYTTLTDRQPDISLLLQYTAVSLDGDSDIETEVQDKKNKNAYRLTPAEIEKYSNLYIKVHGQRYNVLNVLVNKARDLRMCERYKDLKSIGRGYFFKGSNDI